MTILSASLFYAPVHASYGGGYAGASIRTSLNAREAALAGAVAAFPVEGFLQFQNPALITFAEGHQAGLSYHNLTLDRSQLVLSYNHQVPPKGAMGFGIIYSGVSDIQGRDLMGQKTSEYSVSEGAGIITFGIQLSERLSVGANIRALFSSLDNDVDGNGISVDGGILYKINPKLNAGFRMSSVFGDVTWNEEGGSVTEQLPGIVSLAGSYAYSNQLTILLQADGYHSPDQDFESRFRMGCEGQVYDSFYLRLGAYTTVVDDDTDSGTLFTPVFGLGLDLKLWQTYPVRFDYALDTGRRNEGSGHLLTWSIQI